MSLARTSTRSAPSSASSSPRSGCSVPPASESGARSGAAAVISRLLLEELEEGHPGLHRNFDQLGTRRGERFGERVADLVATGCHLGRHPVTAGNGGDVEGGEVEARRGPPPADLRGAPEGRA